MWRANAAEGQKGKWSPTLVLNVLHQLVDVSNINEQLEAFKRGDDPATAAGVMGPDPLYKMLGFFSLVGLLRMQCLFGAQPPLRAPPMPPGARRHRGRLA